MRLLIVLLVGVCGVVLAQSSYKLIIEGKTASSGWINLNGKAYIPLEALQKAGVKVSKNGNTYSLTLPKISAKPLTTVAAVPVASPAKPIVTNPVKPIVTDPVKPAPVTDPVKPVPVSNSVKPVVPTTPPSTASSTSPNSSTSGSGVATDSNPKPKLEGCSQQILNNGIWQMRLRGFASLMFEGKAGFVANLEITNISAKAVSLFDTGFSDGEGNANNFLLEFSDGIRLAANLGRMEFLYIALQPKSQIVVELLFVGSQSSMPNPIKLVVGQDRVVSGFSMRDPSLRFELTCQ
jgi:hypothetical protein